MTDKRDGTEAKWKGRIVTYEDDLGRMRWRREEAPPEVDMTLSGVLTPCRAAYPDEVPLGARRLAERAARAAWRGRVTYARGWRMARRGRPLVAQRVDIDSIAVRLVHVSGWRAVAVWENGRTAGAWLWLPGGEGRYRLPHDVGVTVVTEWIAGAGRLTVAQAIEVSARES